MSLLFQGNYLKLFSLLYFDTPTHVFIQTLNFCLPFLHSTKYTVLSTQYEVAVQEGFEFEYNFSSDLVADLLLMFLLNGSYNWSAAAVKIE